MLMTKGQMLARANSLKEVAEYIVKSTDHLPFGDRYDYLVRKMLESGTIKFHSNSRTGGQPCSRIYFDLEEAGFTGMALEEEEEGYGVGMTLVIPIEENAHRLPVQEWKHMLMGYSPELHPNY